MPHRTSQHPPCQQVAKRANTLHELKRLWPEAQPKRALGGWWSLSGFTFQMLVALEQFLRGNFLQTVATSIGVEELSDILLANANDCRLTQVKRTLTNETLASAIREAYEILKLAEEPLSGRLVFQIVCQEDKTTRAVNATTGDQVFAGEPYSEEIFAKTLKRFDQSAPVLVSAHPASAILQTLWNAGVENPVAAMAKALGYIFAAFDGQVRDEVRSGVMEALDSIRTSIKTPRIIGRLLGAADFAIHATSSLSPITFYTRPRLEDLRLNRFIQRKERLNALEAGAVKWLACVPRELKQFKSQLPVFWIEGRRGDGKSVALLQLAERLLSTKRVASITELRDIDEFRLWLDTRRAVSSIGDELPIDVAFIDDLPAAADADTLDAFIDNVFFRDDRAAALLTCGTSEDLANFSAMTRAAIETVAIRPPDETELDCFRDWLETRTGEPIEKLRLADSSLAAWLFESIGSTRRKPAEKALREKLEKEGLFDVARIAAAVNACGVPAPRSLFSDNVVERLGTILAESSDTVTLNLEVFKDGLRVGHSEAIQSLYKSWSGEECAKQLGPDLAIALRAMCKEGNERLARQLLGQLMDRKYLQRRFGVGQGALVEFSQVIWKGSFDLPRETRAAVIPLWLTLGKAARLPAQVLPDVRRDAVALLKADTSPDRLQAEIAQILYVTSKHGDEERSAAEAIILRSIDPKVISTLRKICEKRTGTEIPHLVTAWLQGHPQEPAAAAVIQALLSTPSEKILDLACDFVERNLTQASSGDVLWTIALGNVRTRRFYPIVTRWLRVAPDPIVAARLFARQLRSSHGDDYVTRALAWTSKNMGVKGIHEVLAALVVRAATDPEVTDVTRRWLLTQPTLSDANPLLLSMIKSDDLRSEGLRLALDRLDRDHQDESWRYLFYQIKEELGSMPPQKIKQLAGRLPRGPANILIQMQRGAATIGNKSNPSGDRHPRRRRQKYRHT